MTWNDEKLDRAVGLALRAGVILAALVVLAGGIWNLSAHAGRAADHRTFRGADARLTELHTIAHEAGRGQPLFLIQLGLLILIATPVVRVILCAAGFALERDWTYTVVSLIVLALLGFSLFGRS